VLEPGAIDYVDGDQTVWEREPMERLEHNGNLAAYPHEGYWQNMDTLRDKMVLEQEWAGVRSALEDLGRRALGARMNVLDRPPA
jgi:glucose-1-phosphate cytidylyltransferase